MTTPQIVFSIREHAVKDLSMRLYRHLSDIFGELLVCPSVKSLVEPGDDFVEAIQNGITNSRVLLVIIGEHWIDSPPNWIDYIDDFDVIALRTALSGTQRVIPILAEGALMPAADRLPADFQKLIARDPLHLTEVDFDSSVTRLVNSLRKVIPQITDLDQPSVMNMPVPYEAPVSYTPPIREFVGGSERTILKGIDPTAFQHPFDRTATENLRKLKGFDIIMSKYLEFGFERRQYFLNIANSILVGPNQFAPLYEMLTNACYILDMPVPDMYVNGSPMVNAITFGHTRPYIMLYAGLLKEMDDAELMAVIAHELGHIKCGHVLYRSMAVSLKMLMETLTEVGFGVGGLLSIGLRFTLQAALLTWYRRSELTADRAALLVTQDARPCVLMLAKLAGGGSERLAEYLNPGEFLDQARRYHEDESNLDSFYRFWAGQEAMTHPFPVERAKFLNEWIDSPEYDQILAGNYARQLQVRGGLCPNCGQKITAGLKFCPMCGRPTEGLAV